MLTSSGLDLESQLMPRNPPRESGHEGFLSLHEQNLIHRADDRGSLAFLRSLSSRTSYCSPFTSFRSLSSRTSYYSPCTSFDDDRREAVSSSIFSPMDIYKLYNE